MRRFIRKVDLARLESVSKARVSQWIREKVIEQEPDGRLNRKKVCGQLREWRIRRTKKLSDAANAQTELIDINAIVSSFCKEPAIVKK